MMGPKHHTDKPLMLEVVQVFIPAIVFMRFHFLWKHSRGSGFMASALCVTAHLVHAPDARRGTAATEQLGANSLAMNLFCSKMPLMYLPARASPYNSRSSRAAGRTVARPPSIYPDKVVHGERAELHPELCPSLNTSPFTRTAGHAHSRATLAAKSNSLHLGADDLRDRRSAAGDQRKSV